VATLQLLEKQGLRVTYPLKQTCCGQPLANSGSEREARECYRHFVDCFKGFDYVVTPSGSCAYQVIHHFDTIEQTDEVKHLRATTFELCSFLTDVLKIEHLDARFPHRVGLHQSCHGLRGLKIASASELIERRYSKARRLLGMVKDIQLIDLDRTDECCGFGGTFSVFEPDVSVKMGRDRIADHERNGAEYITSYDMSCLMHLEGIIRHARKPLKVIHIAEILNNS